MKEQDIMAAAVAKFGNKVLRSYEFRGQCAITIRGADLRSVLTWLRDEPGIQLSWLMDVGGADYLGYPNDDDREWRFEVAYQMYSMELNHRFRVKVAVPEDQLDVPSVWDLWGIANWMEREVFDLFGVNFVGHPNQRRIMCHDDFEGHALRKDYPITKRQKLTVPAENLLCSKSEYA